MTVTTTQYVRKPLYVEAIRISRENFEDVAKWCQGEIKQDEIPGKGTGKKYIKVRVHNPKNPRQTKAMVGDWILYTERGYKIYTNKAFHLSFDDIPENTAEEPQDGHNIVVIGPECFAQVDGSVVCWKGINYVPQELETFDEVVESLQETGGNGTHSEVTEAAREAAELEEARGEGLQGPSENDGETIRQDEAKKVA